MRLPWQRRRPPADGLAATLLREHAEAKGTMARPHGARPRFDELERALSAAAPALAGVHYPAVITDLYQWEFEHLQFGPIRFIDSRPGRPLDELRTFQQEMLNLDPNPGYLVIADDGNDGGVLCVDTRPASEHPGSVVLIDHEDDHVEVLYDDADSLVRCALAHLRTGRVSSFGQHGGTRAASYYAHFDE